MSHRRILQRPDTSQWIEHKRTLRRQNLVLIVVAIELLPITLVALCFLVTFLIGYNFATS